MSLNKQIVLIKMGNLCCEEQRNSHTPLPEEKVKIVSGSKSNSERPAILKPDDFQSRRYLGKGTDSE
jgi:hypothetical protein